MPWAHEPQSAACSEALAYKFQANSLGRGDLVMAIFLRRPDGGEGLLVDGTGLHRFDWTARRFEVGYRARRGHTGQWPIAEAMRAVTTMR